MNDKEKIGKTLAKRKHELMYQIFGRADGLCKDCKYFQSYKYHDYRYRKCEIYGITSSEASDWTGRKQACGLYPDKETSQRDIIKLVRGGRKREEAQIDGQMSLEDLWQR